MHTKGSSLALLRARFPCFVSSRGPEADRAQPPRTACGELVQHLHFEASQCEMEVGGWLRKQILDRRHMPANQFSLLSDGQIAFGGEIH